jgi:lipoprotein-anchoring transpeptidase ErfK/SrfK
LNYPACQELKVRLPSRNATSDRPRPKIHSFWINFWFAGATKVETMGRWVASMKAKSPVKSIRHAVVVAVLATGFALGLAGCVTTSEQQSREPDPAFARRLVTYASRETPGTIVVDPGSHYLYLLLPGGQAVRYGVGVGGEGFGWSGVATVHTKQEWPDWYPPAEMLERKPDLKEHMVQLQSGLGMRGGPENPIGARALYLWQGNKDTLYRIHGTNEPWTIGHNVSAGCIRMTNEDITDLYDRALVGTKVVVLPTASAPIASAQ